MRIIEQNAFRILGLPVTATAKEIARREEELEAYSVVGEFPALDTDFPWIGEVDRSQESIKGAIQILNNPSLKLQHSLFWFWVYTSDDLSAMRALGNGNVEEASTTWNNAIKKHKLNLHNISHLKNVTVLSYMQSFLCPDFDHQKFIVSVKSWGRLLSTKSLLNRLALLHPDLKDEINADRLAYVVSDVLHSSVKKMLTRWIENDNCEKTVACFEAFSEGGFPQTIQNRITTTHIGPIQKNIDRLCEKVNSTQFTDMNDLLVSVQEFRDSVFPELDKLKRLLSASDPGLEHYFDKASQVIRDNAIDYGNNTKDWVKTKELCESAKDIAIGPVLKETLDSDLTIVSQNVDYQRIYSKLLPIDHAPGLTTWNTIGTMLYGSSNFDINTNSYETTLYFVVLFIPLFPLSRYRVIKEGDRYRFLGKLPFRQTEKWHLGLFLFSVTLFLIFLISAGGGSNRYGNHSENKQPYNSTPSNLQLSNPPSYETNPRTDETKREISSLESAIEADREQLRAYESELQRNRSLLDLYDTRLNNLKNQIEDAESKSQRGLYVDETVYQSNLDAYNSLVVKYNTEADKVRQLYDRYEKLLKTTNEKIDRYNHLIGAK